MKSDHRQGGATDLNLFTTGLGGGILGYATFPSDYARDKEVDGVVVAYDSLPGVDARSPYNLGLTAVHEVGHWLGLYHTFQAGCARKATGGDGVPDTPAEYGPNFGDCSTPVDTCTGRRLGGNDPIHNYMDYSDDACLSQFSSGQYIRILKHWTTYRLGKK